MFVERIGKLFRNWGFFLCLKETEQMRSGDIVFFFNVMTLIISLLHFEIIVFHKRKSFLVAGLVKGQYVC